MTCRDEVLDAFEALHRSTGRVDFAPSEILAQVRRTSSLYKDSTVRTHVVAHMPADGSVVRSAPGTYRLARHRHHPVEEQRTVIPTETRLTEDFVKDAVRQWLESGDWKVDVRWGRERGIDIEAQKGSQRWVIEAKGQAQQGPQQVNYFLNALGEIAQRMDDPAASYGLALPDHKQYRGLVDRLPSLARTRLNLTVLFVDAAGTVSALAPLPPPP